MWRQRVRIRQSRQDKTPDRRYRGGMVRAQLAVPEDIFPGLNKPQESSTPTKRNR